MAATPTNIPPESGTWSGSPLTTVVVPFNEAGAAGTYTATVAIPAKSQMLNVTWMNSVLWTAGSSAAVSVGDTASSTGYLSSLNIKTTPTVAVKAFESVPNATASVSGAGGYTGYPFYNSADTITATVTTTGTAASVGRSFLVVAYTTNIPLPASPTQA